MEEVDSPVVNNSLAALPDKGALPCQPVFIYISGLLIKERSTFIRRKAWATRVLGCWQNKPESRMMSGAVSVCHGLMLVSKNALLIIFV